MVNTQQLQNERKERRKCRLFKKCQKVIVYRYTYSKKKYYRYKKKTLRIQKVKSKCKEK